MQTFLPYPDIRKSLECLDQKRLGKQRVEANQILQALEYRRTGNLYKVTEDGKRRKRGWITHPAVIAWEGYAPYLMHYYNTALDVWSSRGYNNVKLQPINITKPIEKPWWLGNRKIHASHKANLLRKALQKQVEKGTDVLVKWYGQYGWNVVPMDGYFWPLPDKTLRFKKTT